MALCLSRCDLSLYPYESIENGRKRKREKKMKRERRKECKNIKHVKCVKLDRDFGII